MNLDTDAIKSARELISGIAINVSTIVIQAKRNGPSACELSQIMRESRDQVSRDGNDLDQRSGIRHRIQRRENSFFSSRIKERTSPSGGFSLSEFARNILRMYMKITSFNCYGLQFYEQLHERLKEALQNNVTRSTGLYAFVPD
ncbi:hypothetical protein G5I_09875 [Acromyrmex echinatior]|uniref:Uncharacterized protein n=1 Tax=Acromyrmex echinatior TaxID=103372 RepID=F4WVD7_ACREC|nr:hypothetical protein G5I_09875 [Acromyrmex echinatior]